MHEFFAKSLFSHAIEIYLVSKHCVFFFLFILRNQRACVFFIATHDTTKISVYVIDVLSNFWLFGLLSEGHLEQRYYLNGGQVGENGFSRILWKDAMQILSS